MTDVKGKRFLISAKNSEAKIAYVDGNKTPVDTVEAMEILIKSFDDYSGYDENDENPIHRPSTALYHYKGTTASGLFASNEYIHYSADSARSMFAGNVQGWGFLHEFAHQIENSDMRLIEVTNNLYSVYVQKAFGNIQRNFTSNQSNVDKYFTYEGSKGFGGFPGDEFEFKFGLFERLLVFTQITNYFGDEVYGQAARLIRENPSRYNSTGSYQAIINAMSEATGYDLTSHFEYYNYPITDETKAFTSQFKTLDKKIRYTTIDTYKKVEEKVQTFNQDTKAVITNVKRESDGFTLTMSTNDSNEGTIAYEIYRDGKLVGFNRTGTYKDVVDSSQAYKYEVIAYDYRANESIKSDVFNTGNIIYMPSLIVDNTINIEVNSKFNPLDYVQAFTFDNKEIDKSLVKVTNNVDEKNTGKYKVIYEVEDRGNTMSKTIDVVVYENLNVTKSEYGQLSGDLNEYNNIFKIPVSSISNNGGRYGNSIIQYAIDGNLNSHWETGNPNSATFKNEVTFDLGEVTEVNTMSYKPRNGGKGAAREFEVYVSTDAEGNDFTLIGKGEYNGNRNDVIQFDLGNVSARRIKFKFIDASENWASIGEMSFYRKDDIAHKVNKELFTDNTKTNVTESYNTLEKLQALREEVSSHILADAFKDDLSKAEEIVKAKYPTLKLEKESVVKLNSDFNLMTGVTATDKDGNEINNIIVDSSEFKINKSGVYKVSYTVTDERGYKTVEERNITVYSESDYVSDKEWVSSKTQYGEIRKDNRIKLSVDGEEKDFAKGIGIHANGEIEYDLSGEDYYYFESYIGVDRTIAEQNHSSIIFKVLADGQEVYNSGVMRWNDKAKFVRVLVKGVNKLKLVVTDANNGNTCDHAVFADTKLLTLNAKPKLITPESALVKVGEDFDLTYSAIDAEDGDITKNIEVTGKVNLNRPGKYPITYKVVDSDGNETTKSITISVIGENDYTYLTEYEWQSADASWGTVKKNKSIENNTLTLTKEDGSAITFERGIGTHATSTIIYDLSDKNYSLFSSYVGVDREMYNSRESSIKFEVYVDGVKKFDSGLMTAKTPMKYVEVQLAGAKQLKLVVNNGGNGIGGDHGSWCDTKLHFINEEKQSYEKLESLEEVN